MIKAMLHYIFPRRQLLALIEQEEERYHMTMRETGWFTMVWTVRQFIIAGVTVWENREEVRDESLINWAIEQVDDHETNSISIPVRESHLDRLNV